MTSLITQGRALLGVYLHVRIFLRLFATNNNILRVFLPVMTLLAPSFSSFFFLHDCTAVSLRHRYLVRCWPPPSPLGWVLDPRSRREAYPSTQVHGWVMGLTMRHVFHVKPALWLYVAWAFVE